jgi:hypothetical protein
MNNSSLTYEKLLTSYLKFFKTLINKKDSDDALKKKLYRHACKYVCGMLHLYGSAPEEHYADVMNLIDNELENVFVENDALENITEAFLILVRNLIKKIDNINVNNEQEYDQPDHSHLSELVDNWYENITCEGIPIPYDGRTEFDVLVQDGEMCESIEWDEPETRSLRLISDASTGTLRYCHVFDDGEALGIGYDVNSYGTVVENAYYRDGHVMRVLKVFDIEYGIQDERCNKNYMWGTPSAWKKAHGYNVEWFDPCPYPPAHWDALEVNWFNFNHQHADNEGNQFFVNPPYRKKIVTKFLQKCVDTLKEAREKNWDVKIHVLLPLKSPGYYKEFVDASTATEFLFKRISFVNLHTGVQADNFPKDLFILKFEHESVEGVEVVEPGSPKILSEKVPRKQLSTPAKRLEDGEVAVNAPLDEEVCNDEFEAEEHTLANGVTVLKGEDGSLYDNESCDYIGQWNECSNSLIPEEIVMSYENVEDDDVTDDDVDFEEYLHDHGLWKIIDDDAARGR